MNGSAAIGRGSSRPPTASPPRPPARPVLIDAPYRHRDCRGGMGGYRATDLELGRDVAVKILSEAVSSSRGRDRLLREARAAATLNHPRIVAIHDVGEHNGSPFIVMELVAGSSLAHERMSAMKEIVEIASQICEALEHSHAHDWSTAI